ILRQTRTDAVDVVFSRISALRLQIKLMPFFLAEAHDLIFDRWTIPWPSALNLPAIHRRPMQIRPNQVMHFLIRVSDVTRDLGLHDLLGAEAKGNRLLIPRLLLQAGKINRSTVKPARRPRLEPRQLKAPLSQTIAESQCYSIPCPASG